MDVLLLFVVGALIGSGAVLLGIRIGRMGR